MCSNWCWDCIGIYDCTGIGLIAMHGHLDIKKNEFEVEGDRSLMLQCIERFVFTWPDWWRTDRHLQGYNPLFNRLSEVILFNKEMGQAFVGGRSGPWPVQPKRRDMSPSLFYNWPPVRRAIVIGIVCGFWIA